MNRILLTALTLLACGMYPARAWNALGHRAVAEIVWRQMNASQRQSASALLRRHPHYEIFLTVDIPTGVDRDEWVFLTAAVWPDWVRPARAGQPVKPRSVTKYNAFPHGIGYAYIRASDRNCASLGKFVIPQPDAAAVLSNSLVTLRDHSASAHDRAVSLCWGLHLYGDLHQPLHVANLCTPAKPNGTSLGGKMIVLGEDGQRIDLHSYWDRLLGTDFSYQAVATAADELQGLYSLPGSGGRASPRDQGSTETQALRGSRERLPSQSEEAEAALPELWKHRSIPAWVQEGYQRAATLAYAEGRIDFADADELAAGKVSGSAVPHLKPEYVRDSHRMAQRCLALAAFRLGDALKGAW